jgi:selenocysteine lyase/cysteine desulfurase
MLDSFGLEGAVRVSPLHCHSAADIDRFLRITREICETFAAAPAR